jgi:acetyl-CoA carboxylase biotin carboxylase subunit
VDTALQPGDEIPLHYDPLIAKLIAWGRDREEALARLRRAVDEFVVAGPGIRTTLPFHREFLGHPDFTAGRLDIGMVDRLMPHLVPAFLEAGPEAEFAAIAAAIRATEDLDRPAVRETGPGLSPWVAVGRRSFMDGRLVRRPEA